MIKKLIPIAVFQLLLGVVLLSLYHQYIFVPAQRNISDSLDREHSMLRKVAWHDRHVLPCDNNSFVKAAQLSREAVVYILAYQKLGNRFFSEGYRREKASGVIIDPDGYIATNYHVIKDANHIEITLSDKREFVAEVVGIDEAADIALLKVEADALPYIAWGDSDSLQVGEWVLAIGNPFGLRSTVTAGIVSAQARSLNSLDGQGVESFIQTDAVVNPGSSGGALINTKGQLVGINTAIISSTGSYDGLSFAIPAVRVKKVVQDLMQYGAVQRARVGVNVETVNNRIAEELLLPSITGVRIVSIQKNSAAAHHGLKVSDVVVQVDGQKVNDVAAFYEIIAQYRPGDEVSMDVIRNGQLTTQDLILRNHMNTTDYIAIRRDNSFTELGMELRALSAEEQERLQSQGVLVVSIAKDSPIARTNMEPGFIIEYCNDTPIRDLNQLSKWLEETSGEITFMGFYERYPGRFPYTLIK